MRRLMVTSIVLAVVFLSGLFAIPSAQAMTAPIPAGLAPVIQQANPVMRFNMSVAGCGAVVRMAAFGGACATDTAEAITADTVGAITSGAITEATVAMKAPPHTSAGRAGACKAASANRIAAPERSI